MAESWDYIRANTKQTTRPMHPANESPSRAKDETLLLLVVLIWGVNFPVLKSALDVMPITVVNAIRFIFSTLTLGIAYALNYRKSGGGFWDPLKRDAWRIIGLGLLVYVFYQLFFIVGLDRTTAGSAALILASAPLWTAVTAHGLRYERLGTQAWLGLLICMVGTGVVVWAGPAVVHLGIEALVGNMLMLGSAVLWGLFTTLGRPVLHRVTPTALAFFGLCVSLPFLLGIAAPSVDEVIWSEVDVWVWLAIIFSGALSTGIAIVIWNQAVLHLGSSHTAVFNNLVPFVALLGGFALLNEPVNAAQIAGGLLIIGGLAVMRVVRRKHP